MKRKLLLALAILVILAVLIPLGCMLLFYFLPIKSPSGEISYYKGVMLPPQGGDSLFEVLREIWKARQLGANIISIHPEFELGEDGRPRVAGLWSQDIRLGENWRRSLAVMVNFAHLVGLRVEIKPAEVTGGENGSIEYRGEPEDYINGYLDATRELAEIAETRNVHQFTIWSEVDHIVMQGRYGTVDLARIDKNFDDMISDWSKRMLAVIREHFNGKVGVGFSGILDNLAHYKTIDIEGFDYLEFSFYGDVFKDYATNTPANAVKATKEYRKLAQRNGIDTVIIGETALEEHITDLGSAKRQQIYRDYFQATGDKVAGHILNSTVSYYNYDGDLEAVAREWFGRN